MNKILAILEYTEKNKKTRFLYFILIPIFYLMELICFFYFWYKIKKYMLTDENVVNFLDTNEFGYKFHKIYKIDIVDSDNIIFNLTVDEITIKLQYEFQTALTEIIEKNLSFDVENYINLFIFTEKLPNNIKKYTVEIKYFRFYLVKNNLYNLIYWLIFMLSIFLIYYFLLINVNINWINK